MLPSTGYFKVIICPFYSSGLCERPHCHFKHVDPEPSSTSSTAAGALPNSKILEFVNQAIQQVQNDIAEAAKSAPTEKNVPVTKAEPSKPVETATAAITPPSASRRYIPALSIPQYRPTPLSELQKRKSISISPTAARPISSNNDTVLDPKLESAIIYKPNLSISSVVRTALKRNVDSSLAESLNGDDKNCKSARLEDVQRDNNKAQNVIKDSDSCTNIENKETSSNGGSGTKNDCKPGGESDKNSNDEKNKKETCEKKSERKHSTDHKHHHSSSHRSSKSSSSGDTKKKHSSHSSSRRHSHTSSSSHKSSSSHRTSKDSSTAHKDGSDDKSNESRDKVKKARDSSTDNGKKDSSRSKSSSKHKESSRKSDGAKSSRHSHSSRHKSSSSRSRHSHKSSKEKSVKSESDAEQKRTSKNDDSDNTNIMCLMNDNSMETLESSSSSSSDGNRSDGNRSDSNDAVEDNLTHHLTLDDFKMLEESDDVDVECFRIFNEELPQASQLPSNHYMKKHDRGEDGVSSAVCDASTSKKRIAHQPELRKDIPAAAPMRRLSAQQQMHQRFLQLQSRYASQTSPGLGAQKDIPALRRVAESQALLQRKRIAHVSSSLATLKKPEVVAGNGTKAAAEIKRVNESAPLPHATNHVYQKGTRRVAHAPTTSAAAVKRPVIPAEYGSKVPLGVRQRYLNVFCDEFLKICDSDEDAFDRAMAEEKKAYERSSNKSVYLNVVCNALHQLRRLVDDGTRYTTPLNQPQQNEANSIPSAATATPAQKTELSTRAPPTLPNYQNSKVVSHATILNGAKASRMSYSIIKNRFKQVTPDELTTSQMYSLLQPYVMTAEQLDAMNYPRPYPDTVGKALFKGPPDPSRRYVDPTSLERRCCRCSKVYEVDKEGVAVKTEECVYHYGRLFKKRIAGQIESRYTCCQGDGESEGCCVGACHVFEGFHPSTATGYVTTLKKPFDQNKSVYALDCEMCYTTHGNELTRITVIDTNLKAVYETLVKPDNPILDYNTRFSGITAEDMESVTTSIRQVQAVLLSMFSSDTILIGHSLESDLRALKIIHSTVVDTALVFPHKRGLPYKRALRNLMAEHLNKIIQNGVDGHDSQEDAVACMELMLWKVKQDLRSGSASLP